MASVWRPVEERRYATPDWRLDEISAEHSQRRARTGLRIVIIETMAFDFFSAPPEPSDRVPSEYAEYFLITLKAWLGYVCPVGGFLFLAFYGWDWLFIRSSQVAISTLLMRLAFTVAILVFWRLVPQIKSLRAITGVVTGLYLFALLDLIAILHSLPGSLILGVPGLLLVTMLASGMLAARPFAASIVCLIGIVSFVAVSVSSGFDARQIAGAVVFLVSGLLISGVFLFLLERELRQKHFIQVSLQAEKEQSEQLLSEILPRYVIQRIREGASTIAEAVSEVNVIFIDIVGFTEMSRRVAPAHLIEILADVFRAFDEKCERYGVTKIKTIGDAYMAATGTVHASTATAVAAIEFCMEAIQSVDHIAAAKGIPISVRVGVATGAVISGVLSLKRPAYDLWGDTVNLASRMETNGTPGCVHIAETTYWRVKDRFICHSSGLIDVKGMGPTRTFLLEPKRASIAAAGFIDEAAGSGANSNGDQLRT